MRHECEEDVVFIFLVLMCACGLLVDVFLVTRLAILIIQG